MNGYFLFGIRTGCHASLLNAAEDTADGKRFLKAKYHYHSTAWDIVFLLYIDSAGNTREATVNELDV
jgi:hypothetical protein